MAVKNATFKPLLVLTKRETKYITIVETTSQSQRSKLKKQNIPLQRAYRFIIPYISY